MAGFLNLGGGSHPFQPEFAEAGSGILHHKGFPGIIPGGPRTAIHGGGNPLQPQIDHGTPEPGNRGPLAGLGLGFEFSDHLVTRGDRGEIASAHQISAHRTVQGRDILPEFGCFDGVRGV